MRLKYFLFIILLIFFISPSYSKEIIYECDIKDVGSSFFKVNKNKSKTTITYRNSGKWKEWCDYENSTMETLKDSVICHIDEYKINKFESRQKQKIIFDFLFMTLTNETKTKNTINQCKIFNQ